MTTATAIGAFSVAAALATMTPGLDTALVLRTAAIDGKRHAAMAALGIAIGVLVWGSAAALGLAELLAASAIAYEILRWAGAAYLVYLGARMLLRPRTEFSAAEPLNARNGNVLGEVHRTELSWLRRGMLTNLLNPKVGLFYVSFLPQFIPTHATSPRALMLLYAMIHSAEGVLWFGTLIAATERLSRVLRQPRVIKRLDHAMGALFVGFGARLALEGRH